MRVLIKILLAMFVLLSVILPPLAPKKYVFAVLIFSVALHYSFSFSRRREFVFNPVLIILFLSIYLFYGIFGNSDLSLGLQFLSASLSLTLIYIILEFQFDFELILMYSIITLAAFICYMSIGYFSEFISISLPGVQFLIDVYLDFELGYLGVRDFGGFKPVMLHFVSSPILLVAFLICVERIRICFTFGRALQLGLLGSAILVSGSRGIVLFTFLGVMSLFVCHSRGFKKILTIFFITCVVIILMLIAVKYSGDMFSSGEQSNSTKLGHVSSFFDHVDSRLLLVGEGLATYYYSSGVGEMRAQTEVTILDFIRYFGLFGTVLFFLVLYYPIVVRRNSEGIRFMLIRHRDSSALIIFSLYILMSFTNPILLNSFGVLSVLWFWQRAMRAYRNENNMYFGNLQPRHGEIRKTIRIDSS